MVDRTVPFFDLFMLYEDLSNIQEITLKEGFSYRFFDGSDEDIKHWMNIEVSSGDCKTLEDASNGFETYYRHYINALLSRCIFILNKDGLPIATSTAFFLIDPQPGRPEPCDNPLNIPQHITGHLHWVAMREDYKGQGLAKPLITRTMKIMHELGHKGAFLHTQTPSWLACKIYLDLGWKPFRYVSSEEDFRDIVNEKISSLKL